GSFEIFLRGARLETSSALVRQQMEYDRWTTVGGQPFDANRIVLPAASHYLPVAAFLAEELLRSGITESFEHAFRKCEPLIEMALRRALLSEESTLGLLGELRFLEALLAVAATDDERLRAVNAWRGHERSARDFVFGSASLEVKTTRLPSSVHRIGSV